MSKAVFSIGGTGPGNQQAAPIIGIDLGTTFSLAAYMKDGKPTLVRDQEGESRVASAILFLPDGRTLIGQEARRQAVADPSHAAFSIKRLIGRTYAELQGELSFVPFQVKERETLDGRHVLVVTIDDREYTPEELSAMILREVVARASRELGVKIEKAVVTVPAYFDERQRQATRDAGRLAGIDVVRMVNEPTAAALAYGLQERKHGTIVVYDFGGGTFDCSILQLQDDVFKVLSTHGDTHLGGDDIDQRLMTHFTQPFADHLKRDLNASDRQALRDACEQLKIALTTQQSARIDVSTPEANGSASSDSPFQVTMSRGEFNQLIKPMVKRSLASCQRALVDADLSTASIDEVVLVGGTSRIPFVRDEVARFFGKTPHSELNPDEVVAMGAAVQANILKGDLRQLLLLDITPLSLGLETIGGAVSRLIPRNSTIPARVTDRYTTYVDNQTGVDLHILQGERELAKDCRSLGRFKLSGIPPMPAGIPQIDVTFLIDANGILQVSAKELKSGQSTQVEIRPTHGLDRDEIERMIRASIDRGQEDLTERKLIDLRTKAESNIMYTRKALDRLGDRVDSRQRASITQQQSALEAVLARTRPTETNQQAAAQTGSNQSNESRSSLATLEAYVKELQSALDQYDESTMPLAALLMDDVAHGAVAGKTIREVIGE